MLSQITFNPSIDLGNILTIGFFIVLISGAYYTTLARSRANALYAKQLKDRVDLCNIEQMKERVDTMWVFQMRRGLAELEKKKLGYVASPIRLSDTANEAIAPMVPKLKKFYLAIGGPNMGAIELAVKIEQEFGQELSKSVCLHIGINDAACLVLAIAQLRPIGPEDINLSMEKNMNRVHNSMKVSAIPTPLPIRKALMDNQPLL